MCPPHLYGKSVTAVLFDDLFVPNRFLPTTRQPRTASMFPKNTHDEMLAVVNAAKQGLPIEVCRRDNGTEQYAAATNPNFNFMDFRYRVRRTPDTLYARRPRTGGTVMGVTTFKDVAEYNVRRLGGTLVKFVEVTA